MNAWRADSESEREMICSAWDRTALQRRFGSSPGRACQGSVGTPSFEGNPRLRWFGEFSKRVPMAKIIDPERRRQLGERLLEHLEAAQAITDELCEPMAGYLVERALDEARATHWPLIDPNLEIFRRPPSSGSK